MNNRWLSKILDTKNNKKQIENVIFLIVVLVITIIIINMLLKENTKKTNDSNEINPNKILAQDEGIVSTDGSLDKELEKILSTIKGVGEVKVFVNYSETNKTVAMYDETTTTSSTEETDSAGGTRETTSTEKQKEVVYSDEDGSKKPVTEKIIMPSVEGAIITARGASNSTVKTNIINAVEAATGLSIDKIQVFEME